MLSDLHYKLIMNQKPPKKGKTENLNACWEVTAVKSSPSGLPVPTQQHWPTNCPSGEGVLGDLDRQMPLPPAMVCVTSIAGATPGDPKA